MNVRLRLFASAVAAALVAGAAPPSGYSPPSTPPSVTGFHHDARQDLFGYYMPDGEPKFGKWMVSSLNVGTPQDFIDYERGKRDPPEYAPLMIEFDDVTSPETTTEDGASVRSVQRRVLPTAYAIAGDHLVFAGNDAVLGTVTFSGRLDLAAVKRAQDAAGESTESITVLTGDLSVGGKVIRNVKFTWFGGD
jgi:hypothetical protein